MDTLRPTKAPNMPTSPEKYSRQHMDQFKNMLRLYFVEIDNNNQQLTQMTNSNTVTQWLGDLL